MFLVLGTLIETSLGSAVAGFEGPWVTFNVLFYGSNSISLTKGYHKKSCGFCSTSSTKLLRAVNARGLITGSAAPLDVLSRYYPLACTCWKNARDCFSGSAPPLFELKNIW